jgi:hypothetical protein
MTAASEQLEDREARLKRQREQRQRQPAEIKKREERRERRKDRSRVFGLYSTAMWEALREREDEQPLYEALACAIDFSDRELWTTPAFAVLRPRLLLHIRVAILDLEHRFADAVYRGKNQPAERAALKTYEARRALFKARDLLARLEGIVR